MKLLSLNVGRYGKHENLHMQFDGGLQSYVYPNGWGKSTLLSFIKVMFYGFPKNRGKDIVENERSHYMPWDYETASGAVVYETASGIYRLERTFGKKAADDTVKLFDEKTGKEIPCPENLGESLFLIDADGFERTVFLSERQLRGDNDNKSVAARFSDLSGVDGDMGNIGVALSTLEEERKAIQNKSHARSIPHLEEEIKAKKTELSEILLNLRNLDALECELAEKQAVYREKIVQKNLMDAEYRKLPPKHKRTDLLAQIESEKLRTDQNRKTLNAAKTFLGHNPPTLSDIRTAEETDRLGKEAKEKANVLLKTDNSPVISFFTENPLNEKTLSDMQSKAAETKKIPLLLSLCVFGALTVFWALFLPFRTPLFAGIGAVAALLVAACLYFTVLAKRFEAKQSLIAFLTTYRQDVKDISALEKVAASFRAYQEELTARLSEDAEAQKWLALAEKNEKETEAFLCRFPLEANDAYPFETLRQRLSEVSTLTASIADSDRHIAELAEQAASDELVLAEGRYAELEAKTAALDGEISEFGSRITVLSTKVNAFDDLESRKESVETALADLQSEKEKKEKDVEIIKKTKDYLNRSKDALTARYLGPTKETFSKLMREVGEEGEYHLNTVFAVSKEENAVSRVAEEYSRGTRDLYDFVLRLSLNDALYTGEKPFLLLDDPLLALDDEHFAKATAVLKERSATYQVLYFTCTEKRKI